MSVSFHETTRVTIGLGADEIVNESRPLDELMIVNLASPCFALTVVQIMMVKRGGEWD